jgi:glycosyltransferase involved in cell wall biosynthesis
MPKVSVIINCYNGETFVRDALKSALDQTHQNIEIIFWDNRSTDATASIVHSIPDPRIRYFLAESHTTLGEARNKAFEKSTGDWIGYLDVDDLWRPKKIEKQIEIILTEKKMNIGLVYTRMDISGGKYSGRELSPYYIGKLLPEGNVLIELLTVENFIPLSSAIVRRDAFVKSGKIPPHLKQSEDFHLFAAVAATYDVRAVQSIEGTYRVHDNNLTNTQQLLACEESIEVIRAHTVNKNKNEKNKLQRKIHSLCVLHALISLKQRKQPVTSLKRLLCSDPTVVANELLKYLSLRIESFIASHKFGRGAELFIRRTQGR